MKVTSGIRKNENDRQTLFCARYTELVVHFLMTFLQWGQGGRQTRNFR